MEINLGNLYAMINDIENAIEMWNTALKNNEMIGSLKNEGMILMNKGVLNYFSEIL